MVLRVRVADSDAVIEREALSLRVRERDEVSDGEPLMLLEGDAEGDVVCESVGLNVVVWEAEALRLPVSDLELLGDREALVLTERDADDDAVEETVVDELRDSDCDADCD